MFASKNSPYPPISNMVIELSDFVSLIRVCPGYCAMSNDFCILYETLLCLAWRVLPLRTLN